MEYTLAILVVVSFGAALRHLLKGDGLQHPQIKTWLLVEAPRDPRNLS